MSNETMTVSAAAKKLHVTEQHVRLLVRTGKLKAVRTTPRRTFILVDSLESMINENNPNN